tara:strand:+ start:139 stop:462 length:324 start_codon:yes stop_codon:yes gene_type:complete
MNVKGKLHLKGETQQITEKFSKREFVIQTEDKYPQLISLQLTQDKCGLLDEYEVGDAMDVDINIRGREWASPKGEVKYFNTLEAWRFNRAEDDEVSYESKKADDIPF